MDTTGSGAPGAQTDAAELARQYPTPLSIEDVKRLLPHRPPFLLVDRVVAWEPGKTIEAIKCVSADEPFFAGHFPEYNVMPGVLIVEALAQTAGLLAAMSSGGRKDGELFLFAAIDKARFRRQVTPGDVLHLRCELLFERSGVAKFKAVASVEGATAAEAEITCARRMR